MSVFFEGNAFIDGGKVEDTQIVASAIRLSSIDMNLENITSVKDPIQPQDAATKKYVDDSINTLGVIQKSLVLTGTNYTLISSSHLKGSYSITVNPGTNVNGPSATFFLSKGRQNQYPHIVRHTCSPGEDTRELLELKWDPNSGIYFRKTGNNHNGFYNIKLF